MLKKPIYANYQHEAIVKEYLALIINSIDDLTGKNEEKFNDFLDVCNIIIDYHNKYKMHATKGNYHDFLSIIPTNFSIMTTGFLCGFETKRNRKKTRAYRFMLSDIAFKVVEDLEKIKPDIE